MDRYRVGQFLIAHTHLNERSKPPATNDELLRLAACVFMCFVRSGIFQRLIDRILTGGVCVCVCATFQLAADWMRWLASARLFNPANYQGTMRVLD
jgi:hypothetical protein